MLGGPAPVLVTQVPQVTLVRVGVGQMALDGVVDRRLGQLAEARRQAGDEGDDEQEPHGQRW